jgi:ParB family chromosome partitioning protein
MNLSEIKLSSEYLRLETDTDALQKSIEKVGLINPLTINTENELLAGARRYQAVTALGWTEVPVHVVERQTLEQELISIDENLVRTPLDKLEFEKCLNRGREIYEELNPLANKIDMTIKELTSEEKKKEKELEEQDQDSFAAVTAEKTGLSKSVIKGAIKRDALASEAVKAARRAGDINASQTNEIIKLDKDIQERILPVIADKTVKEAKKIITAAKSGGMDAAIEESESIIPLPKEFANLRNLSKRVNKNLSRILLEELVYEGPELKSINKEIYKLKENLDTYFRMMNLEAPAQPAPSMSVTPAEVVEHTVEPIEEDTFNPEYMSNEVPSEEMNSSL